MWRALRKILLLVCCTAVSSSFAAVVNPAPNFAWEAASRANSLRAVKGQPVVLLIAKNARNGAFRKQVKNLRKTYEEFASKKVVFAAALEDGTAPIRADIPFAVALDGARVAADFGVDRKFAIVIIGRDGNIDYQTSKVLSASRIRDVITNSFAEQNARRR